MNLNKQPPTREAGTSFLIKSILTSGVLLFLLFVAAILILFFTFTPLGSMVLNGLKWLFAADSQQVFWYVTRSAAIIAYLLLWLSTIWGLAVPSRIIQPVLDQGYTFDFHQFISLLSIGFALLHVLVLMADRYMPYTLAQILVPFLSPYRPIWVGIGVLSFYILLLVTITFYIRTRIGVNTFKALHVLSLLGYLGVTLHGLYAGTDAPLVSMQLLYRGTGLVVIFLTVYWLVMKIQQGRAAKKQPLQQAARRTR